jgi:hypothetical protein
MAKKITTTVACTAVAVLAKKEVGFTRFALGCGLFHDINFADLDASITALGQQQNIVKEDRAHAVEVINQWRNNVQERIQDHSRDVNTIIGILDGSKINALFDDEYRARITQLVSTMTKKEQDAWKQLEDKILVAQAAVKAKSDANHEIYNEVENPDESPAERILRQSNLKKEVTLADVALSRANYQAKVAYVHFVGMVGKHEVVKKLIEQAKPYLQNLARLRVVASEKAQDAKINVSISNGSVRDALRAMQSWSKTAIN